jgi:septal ring factor EnvC (AmiA/AmiB activator)
VADSPQRRTEGWSRQRGIVAAVVAIAVVAGALILSRLDMANELAVVRSQLTAANQEIAENQRELDELEDLSRNQTESLDTCRTASELGERIRRALETLQRGLDRGDEGVLAKGVAEALRLQQDWETANRNCLEATAEEE